MYTEHFNPFNKSKHKPYELSGIGFTILFFWLLGDEKLLYFQSFCLVDIYNLLFTIIIVFATWLLFKWIVWRLQSIKNKYALTTYYLIQTSITGAAMLSFIFISNWIYIYLIWQKSFEENYFLTVIFPTAAIFSVVWNLIEFCYFLYTKTNTSPFSINEKISSSQSAATQNREQLLWVKSEKNHIKLTTDDIAYVILQDTIVWFVLFDGRKFITEKTLNQLEGFLPKEFFFRATRQLILSNKAILRIEEDTNQKIKAVYLRLGGFPDTCIVSRYKASAFKKFSRSTIH